MGFRENTTARIPFVVAGIFLIIVSSITSLLIIEIESQEAENVVLPHEMQEIGKMVTILQSDMSNALNMAGMEAMDYAGRHPVIMPNINSRAAMFYNGGSWENYEDGWSHQERRLFNENWIKNMIRKKLNDYIEKNYRNDAYSNGRYSINVDYIDDISQIKVNRVYMQLKRNLSKFHSLQSFFGIEDEIFPTYWKVSIPLKIEIKNDSTGEIVDKRYIEISSIITSRFPLMEKMMEEFENLLNNRKISQNRLFLLFTSLSQMYTEGRSLLQYAGLYEKIPNIVDNRWICYVLNSAVLLEEFLMFNSIDPISALYLILHWKDLASYGYPERRDVIEGLEDKKSMAGIDPLQTLTHEENAKKIYRQIMKKSRKGKVSIGEIAETILYKTKFLYTYYNESYRTFYNSSHFEGYRITHEGRKYHYIPPPPYYYYNISTEREIIKYRYFGRTITENGLTYFVRFGNESHAKERKEINEEVFEKIEEEINESYRANFSISVEREEIDEHYEPPKTSFWNCKKKEGKWILYEIHNITPLHNITSFPYTEEWEVEWHKYEVIGHRKPLYENGKFMGYICEGENNFTYVKKEKIRFVVEAMYPDVYNIFNQTDLILSTTRHDNNLFYLLENFSRNIFIPFREKIIREYGKEEVKVVTMPVGENVYAMKWLRGRDGEAITSLKEMLKEIKEENLSVEINGGSEEAIEDVCQQLLHQYREKMEDYIGNDKYLSTKGLYRSCGARVIAKIKEWYAKEIEKKIEEMPEDLKNEIKKEIGKGIGGKIDFDEIEKARREMPKIDLDSIPLQFGITMSLFNSSLAWEEKIGFSINQQPDYFLPGKEFSVSNVCVFGPSGLPLLPTPVTPWVVTMNAWYIHIEGTFLKFEITDTSGKMNPNILFGASTFSYVRENESVYDPSTGEQIGWNRPISFSIDTINVGITPPAFFGDKNPGSYPIEKEGGK